MSWSGYTQFVLALVFVLSLVGGLAFVARRLGYGHAVRDARSRRLKLVEVMAVDARRRLVLIRRDHVEHLLLIGPSSEHVIETGIGADDDADGSELAASFASHLSAAGDKGGAITCATL